MKRRQFLGTAVGATVAVTSGCLGYSVESTDDINQMESTISNQTGKIEQLENETDRLSTEINSLEESNEEAEQELTQAEEDFETAQHKQILYLYGYGITMFNSANDNYAEAIGYYDQGLYDDARGELLVSLSYYDSAGLNFYGAKERAEDIGEFSLASDISLAEDKADTLADASDHFQLALYNLTNGNNAQANSYWDRGLDLQEDANQYDPPSRSDLENELGTTIESGVSSGTMN